MGRRAFIYAAGEYKPGDIKLFKRIRLKDDDLCRRRLRCFGFYKYNT